jgi:DNA-cytosine methyltransferase
MNVLSLFDGISCGKVALDRAGIPVTNYFAAEIDKYALAISKKNHTDIVYVGDVTQLRADDLPKIDLLIGGSPCQGFSFAGKGLNFDDPRSKLFFEYVRLKNELNPRWFLLENVKMKKEYIKIINDHLGVEPVEINSALVSAQNRKRLYWTNIPITYLEDKHIFLEDIIENGFVDRIKSYCIDANYFKGGSLKNYLDKKRRQVVMNQSERRLTVFNYSSSGIGNGLAVGRFTDAYKALTLTANGYGARQLSGVIEGDVTWRKLTPLECERLQTLPDNYTEGVSNTQRYKMLGNAWTVDVIAHIFKGINYGLQRDMP